MKKLSISVLVIMFLTIGVYISYLVIDNVASYNSTHDTKNEGTSIVTQTATPPAEGTKEEIKEQTSKIGGVKFDTELNENSTEFEVIDVMHKMTHQKVRSEDKWGAIPMSDDTINQVYEIVSKSNFDNKSGLVAILESWRTGNFESVDEDHNYFWHLQGGTVGEAYGKLNPAEEEEFIKNNFPSINK